MSVAGLMVASVAGASAVADGGAGVQKDARAVGEVRVTTDARARRRVVAAVVVAATTRKARVVTAGIMFDDANRARVGGDYAQALVRYQKLQQRFPASTEAHLSYATMGRMQLDRADAAGALATFDRYEPSGDVDLDELVMAGRALALDELGSESAPQAWAALLDTHPDTPYAQHARLRALGAVAWRSVSLPREYARPL